MGFPHSSPSTPQPSAAAYTEEYLTMASAAKFEKTRSFHHVDDHSDGRTVLSHKQEKKRPECSSTCKPEAKRELVRFDMLPCYLKDNEFILGYYRSEWPLKQTILSIFSVHNETLNIWTHLLGFFVFLVLTMSAVKMYAPSGSTVGHTVILPAEVNSSFSEIAGSSPDVSSLGFTMNLFDMFSQTKQTSPTFMISSMDSVPSQQQSITRWPFFAFLFGAMFCLLTSSACHLLSCHSEHCAYTMLRLDYTGISALIVTSFYPLVYYTFMCDPFIRNTYIGFITVFGISTILVSLVPVFQTPEFRIVRALLFCCMAVSGLVPIFHKMVAFGDRPEAILSACYEMLMGLFYGAGVLVYATRVPERWMPGKFDLVGHSHQLFHVLVIAGAYTHYLASVVYLQWREMEGCPSH